MCPGYQRGAAAVALSPSIETSRPVLTASSPTCTVANGSDTSRRRDFREQTGVCRANECKVTVGA